MSLQKEQFNDAVAMKSNASINLADTAGLKRFSLTEPRVYVPVIALILFALVPLAVNEYYQNILNMILIFSIAGVSWNIFGGYARQVSIGHALFFGIGAYTSTLLLVKLNVSPWIGMLVGGIFSVIVGFVMGMSLMKLRGHYFAIATIVFSQVALLLVTKFRGFTGGAEGLSVPYMESFLMLQFSTKLPYFYIFLAFLVGMLFLVKKNRTLPSGLLYGGHGAGRSGGESGRREYSACEAYRIGDQCVYDVHGRHIVRAVYVFHRAQIGV